MANTGPDKTHPPATSGAPVLLIEDDAILGDGIVHGLRESGMDVHWLRAAEAAGAALAATGYACVILDINLPGMSGLDLLRQVRRAGNRLPILLLTARDGLRDRVAGLDAGADDYLVKPFDLEELAARLRALVRRMDHQHASQIELRDIRLDVAGRRCMQAGREIELSRREFSVLQVLAEHPGVVLGRDRIEQALYAWDSEVESNTVEVHVHHLRRKLGNALIRTVRGVGYVIDVAPAHTP